MPVLRSGYNGGAAVAIPRLAPIQVSQPPNSKSSPSRFFFFLGRSR